MPWPKAHQVAAHPGPFVIDSETDGLEVRGPQSRDRAWVVGLIPLHEPGNDVWFFDTHDPDWPNVRKVLAGKPLIGHNLRFDLHAMDIPWPEGSECTMVAQYRFCTTSHLSLDKLAEIHDWPGKIETIPELKGKKGEQNKIRDLRKGLRQFDPRLLDYLADDVLATRHIYLDMQRGRFVAEDFAVERTVQAMEERGVKLLTEPLAALSQRIKPLVAENEAIIRAHGFNGNIASPPQLTEFLQAKGYDFNVRIWDKKRRKRVDKFSTATKTVLEPYFDRTGDPLIGAIMMYRSWLKKEKDFCQALPGFIGADGLLHGGVKTCRTATARFAHETPNLGQIPKQGKTDLEREIGKAFRACFTGHRGGCSGADFAQVELRVAAILSGDARMLEAFAAGEDLHAVTAAATSGYPVDNLPDGERFKAKATNFGILNGMGPKRLAVQLRCGVDEAAAFIDLHKHAHPELHQWMVRVTQAARACRSVRTFAGFERDYDEGEFINNAVSMKVQGGAATLMRRALVALEDQGLEPILTVHDEIVCAALDKGEEVGRIMQEAAEAALPGPIGFPVDPGSGDTWAAV